MTIALIVAVALVGLLYMRKPRRVPPPSATVARTRPAGTVGATLLEGLGITTSPSPAKPEANQRWFNQGLMLTYGFNHDAAERSFLRATELDPDCAMCWWGAALVVGPHVNAAMDPANNAAAWKRLQKAIALAPKATPREQAFIERVVRALCRESHRRIASRSTLPTSRAPASSPRSSRTISTPPRSMPRR